MLACGALFVCHASVAASQGAADPRIRRVETGLLPIAATNDKMGSQADIRDRMRAFEVPGLSVAVIDSGRIAWAKGYGVSDSRTRRPVTTDTLFQAASISKPITALAALALVQSGELRLDQDVNQKLKTWKVPDNQFTRTQKVTLRLLLNHSAGVADIPFPGSGPGQTTPTLLQVLNGEPPATNPPITIDSIPGSRYSYSRAGYDILQQVLMDASGQPFESFMETEVLRPLGMLHSSFRQPLPASLERIAAAGHYAGGQRIPGKLRTPEMAMAGLWSTPSDLARYLIDIQRAYLGASSTPIGRPLAEDMLRPGKGNRGLGPVISGTGAAARFGHDGFNEGFESSMVGYISRGQGAVVMANSGFSFMLIKEVLDSIARVYGWPQYDSTNQWPPDASMGQQEVLTVPSDLIGASVGEYRLDADHTMQLIERGKHLFIEWPGDGEAEVFATPGGRLFCPQLIFSDFGSPWLKFVREDTGGKTVTKILAGDDASQAFLRLN
jgi:CubicO group peptidase (beta-lactamase class C family)